MRSFCLTAALLSLSSVSNALTSTLQQITGFTAGPTSAGMYMYIPTTKLALAPIIVAIHWCSGSANDYFAGTGYANYADTYGYIVIYPDSPSTDNCWDVASLASLTHNGGGDSLTIINMVRYAVANYGGDINRVYASGLSSGAMMTNVLSGAYPDIIKAGVIYSGVPDGCFYVSTAVAGQATASWNSTCSTGVSSQSAVAWGNLVRSYYPGYTGSYPRLNIYHGTSDFTLAYPLLAEELKEWSNVHGIAFAQNVTDTPLAGYTKMVYGDGTKLLGFSALNVGHSVPVRTEDDLVWFGLMPGPFYPSSSSSAVVTSTTSKTSSSTKGSTTMTTSSKVSTSSSKASSSSTRVSTTLVTSTTTTSSAAVSTSGIPQWGACGGNPWTGSTTCAAPYTCVFFSIWYSQCQ